MIPHAKETAPISAENVSVDQIQVLGEDVLVRAVPLEDRKKIVRDDGSVVELFATKKAQDFLGGVFYGTVLKTGPGRVVVRAPSSDIVADLVEKAVRSVLHDEDVCSESLARQVASKIAARVRGEVEEKRTVERVPLGVKAGDHVAVRFGFGPEVRLREGLHHVIGRGNSQHGHGVVMAWEPAHVHCWHVLEDATPKADGRSIMASCSCGEIRPLETRLPACSDCPSGPRLAEAHRTDRVMDFPEANGSMPGAYEHRPIIDRPGDSL